MTHPLYICMWFEKGAMEAAEYYCTIFDDSSILSTNPMVVQFVINGFKIMALNGNNSNQFNSAASIVLEVDTQEEIDYYWDNLIKGGEEGQCGWLKDKFGFSWQIVPRVLGQLMSDPETGQTAMNSLMQMKKIIISQLK